VRVRVRVIFQNPNPYKRVDLFAIVSAVRTLPEARPTFLDPPTSGEQNRLEKDFQKCNISGKNRNFRVLNGTKTGLFPQKTVFYCIPGN